MIRRRAMVIRDRFHPFLTVLPALDAGALVGIGLVLARAESAGDRRCAVRGVLAAPWLPLAVYPLSFLNGKTGTFPPKAHLSLRFGAMWALLRVSLYVAECGETMELVNSEE
jgi:hypothetical protein